MISHLSGTVTAAGPTWVVLDMGGFGVRVQCPPATAAATRPGATTTLQTSLVVREESLTLYGFDEAIDRDAFELVQTASGVGPKLAVAMMSVMDARELVRAIGEEDLATLRRVPGIGNKGAARIVLELKDKVAALGVDVPQPGPAGTPSGSWGEQVSEGLVGLGWSAKDAERAVQTVAPLKETNPAMTIGELMREALRSLAH